MNRMGALALVLVVGCSVARDPATAWAERQHGLRERATASLEQGKPRQAEALLRRAVSLPGPDTDRARSLRQDLHFALAHLYLVQGDPVRAQSEAEDGLRIDAPTSIFTANLHAARAMALEARGQEIAALPDYQRAMAIHQARFEATLARGAAADSAPEGKTR